MRSKPLASNVSDLHFTNNTILENAGHAIRANGTPCGPSTAYISGRYFEGRSSDIVNWGINGSIDVRHNQGQGLNTGLIYRFDNAGTNSIVVFQDSIWNSYRTCIPHPTPQRTLTAFT